MRPLSVCFVAPEAYPTLAELDEGSGGGAELQQVLLARGLAARGHEVSLIAGDYGQPAEVDIDGVRAIRSYRPGVGNRLLRYPGDSLLVLRAMRRSRADVFFQRCVFHQTGRAWLFARSLGGRFVFSSGHDQNSWRIHELKTINLAYRLGYSRAVRGADLVVCQHEEQRAGFLRNYGRHAQVVPNVVQELPRSEGSGGRVRVLWVGTLVERKQPWIVGDLARRLPEVDFRVVAIDSDEQVRRRTLEACAGADNLVYMGFVPQHDVYELYRTSDVFVSTSRLEGLPNVFLQAMASGLPVASLQVNPDGLLDESGGGLACDGDVERLCAVIGGLASDDAARRAMGDRGRRFVRARFGCDNVVSRYEELFEGLLGRHADR